MTRVMLPAETVARACSATILELTTQPADAATEEQVDRLIELEEKARCGAGASKTLVPVSPDDYAMIGHHYV